MKALRSIKAAVPAILILLFWADAQDISRSGGEIHPATAIGIRSSPTGGAWGSAETWIGGIVPGANDDVVIVSGSSVTIDTAAFASTITIGETGGAPAELRFGETAGLSLTVAGDVMIRPDSVLRTDGNGTNFRVLTIGGDLTNDGTVRANDRFSIIEFRGVKQYYSGKGMVDGAINTIMIDCVSLTLDQIDGLRVREVLFSSGTIVNSNKLILGNNDTIPSLVLFAPTSSAAATGFDVQPNFDLGSGGQSVEYHGGPRATGVEINPQRILKSLAIFINGAINIEGGDLTVKDLNLFSGVFVTGQNKIVHTGTVGRFLGYIDGTLTRQFTSASEAYTFYVGAGAYSPVSITVSTLGINPTYLSVTPVDVTLPGLLQRASVSRYWRLVESGDATFRLTFAYIDADVNGNEVNYLLWRSGGETPALVSGSTVVPSNNIVSTPNNITELSGDWGIGAQIDPGPVSISGSVTSFSGQPIRNALITITGGSLQAPVQTQTGSFGTYAIANLSAGDVYTIRVDAKRYRFSPNTQLVTPLGNITNVNFAANPQD